MIGYGPSSPRVLVELGGLLAATVAAGLGLTRRNWRYGRTLAWLMTAGAVVGAECLVAQQPTGLRMLAICGALLFGFKGIVGASALAAGSAPLPATRWLGFALAWPGMDPTVFSDRHPRTGSGGTSLRGLACVLGGAALLLAAHVFWQRTGSSLLATAPLLVGLSLLLHFGLFRLSAALWRHFGFDCAEPFQSPQSAKTLAEFWGRRWNRPFSELVARTVYRSLTSRGLPVAATMAAFLLSGLLHELAISVPARAGYGRPLGYFVLEGLFVVAEKRLAPNSRSRLRVWIGVLAPLPLILIPDFVRGALWPLAGIRP